MVWCRGVSISDVVFGTVRISFVFIGASISSVMLNASSTALCSTPNQFSEFCFVLRFSSSEFVRKGIVQNFLQCGEA